MTCRLWTYKMTNHLSAVTKKNRSPRPVPGWESASYVVRSSSREFTCHQMNGGFRTVIQNSTESFKVWQLTLTFGDHFLWTFRLICDHLKIVGDSLISLNINMFLQIQDALEKTQHNGLVPSRNFHSVWTSFPQPKRDLLHTHRSSPRPQMSWFHLWDEIVFLRCGNIFRDFTSKSASSCDHFLGLSTGPRSLFRIWYMHSNLPLSQHLLKSHKQNPFKKPTTNHTQWYYRMIKDVFLYILTIFFHHYRMYS